MGGRQAWGQFAVSLEAGPGGLRVLPHRDIWGKTVSRVTGVQLSPWKNGVSFSQTGVLQAEVLSSVKKIMVLFGRIWSCSFKLSRRQLFGVYTCPQQMVGAL